MSNVKRRRYDAGGRRAQAERTRQALIELARDALLTRGYAATTVSEVARACGVSVESVYKRFGGKPGLVRAVVDTALLGEGALPAETRSDALAISDPAQLLAGWARLTAEIAPRVAPILLLLRQAGDQDADLTALALELDDNRRQRMGTNARRLADTGALRPGVSADQAADVLWTYSSPELYDLLVLRSTWPLERYAGFISEALQAHLLPVPSTATPSTKPPPATRPTPGPTDITPHTWPLPKKG